MRLARLKHSQHICLSVGKCLMAVLRPYFSEDAQIKVKQDIGKGVAAKCLIQSSEKTIMNETSIQIRFKGILFPAQSKSLTFI